MIVGSTLHMLDSTPFYSPEFHRGGLSATFATDVTQKEGTGDLIITVQHRNDDETSWTTAGTFSAISATGVFTKDVSDIKEVLRFKYHFDVFDADPNVIHFLMQEPAWRPY